jgi:hypothetical protein
LKQIRLLLLVALLIAACGGGSVFSLEVGTCFDGSEGDNITSVPILDCSEPHDFEVYDVFDYSATDSYPGDDSMFAAAQEGCLATFDAFVGMAYMDSTLDLFTLSPTSGSWDEGDREVVCAVMNVDRTKLVGSMEGAAR